MRSDSIKDVNEGGESAYVMTASAPSLNVEKVHALCQILCHQQTQSACALRNDSVDAINKGIESACAVAIPSRNMKSAHGQ